MVCELRTALVWRVRAKRTVLSRYAADQRRSASAAPPISRLDYWQVEPNKSLGGDMLLAWHNRGGSVYANLRISLSGL